MTKTHTYDSYGNLTAIKIGGQRVWERDSYTGTQQCVPKRRQNSIPKNQ